jgi:hypothetical protein
MFQFLEERYRRLPSDALGSLLGDLQLDEDGKPFDPAMAEEWDRAVASAQQEQRPRIVEPQRRAS